MKKFFFGVISLLSVIIISHSIRSEPTPIVSPSAAPTPVPGMIRIEVRSIYDRPVSDLKVAIFALEGAAGEKIFPCGGFKEIIPKSTSPLVSEKELPPGPYRVEVTAPGWIGELLENIVLEPGEVKELKFKLQPGFMISGMVVDENGLPLPGVKITHRSSGGGSSSWLYSRSRKTISDGGGRFEINSLKEGVYYVKAILTDYIDESVKDVVTGTDDLRIMLKNGFTIKGTIRGNLDGLDKTLSLQFKGGNWYNSGKKVELDAEQEFVVSDLKKGIYALRLKEGDYISDWVKGVEATADGATAVPVILTVYRGGGRIGPGY